MYSTGFQNTTILYQTSLVRLTVKFRFTEFSCQEISMKSFFCCIRRSLIDITTAWPRKMWPNAICYRKNQVADLNIVKVVLSLKDQPTLWVLVEIFWHGKFPELRILRKKAGLKFSKSRLLLLLVQFDSICSHITLII